MGHSLFLGDFGFGSGPAMASRGKDAYTLTA